MSKEYQRGILKTDDVRFFQLACPHYLNLIGPYTVKATKLDNTGIPITLTLTAMTCVDPSTGWFKIVEVPSVDTTSARISRLFNQAWLNRYPMPK